MESAKAFIAQVQANEPLQNELAALLEKGDKEAVTALMKANGVTEQDVSSLVSQDESVSTTGKLSDEALETVSGGGYTFNWCNGIKTLIDSFF